MNPSRAIRSFCGATHDDKAIPVATESIAKPRQNPCGLFFQTATRVTANRQKNISGAVNPGENTVSAKVKNQHGPAPKVPRDGRLNNGLGFMDSLGCCC